LSHRYLRGLYHHQDRLHFLFFPKQIFLSQKLDQVKLHNQKAIGKKIGKFLREVGFWKKKESHKDKSDLSKRQFFGFF